jgi:YVTN family beta-propeller protein
VSGRLEFRVLGPLEVRRDGVELPIRGRARDLLALLLVNADRIVSAERLIDEFWGESVPESAANMIQGYVSRLRKTLGESDAGHRLLDTRPPGYVLHALAAQVDARRFEALAHEGEGLLASGAFDDAVAAFSEALGLWGGSPYADVASSPAIEAEIARLEELRLAAVEHRIDAELALGRGGALIAELEALVREHPYRERLREQLMRSLYRAGRQSDALDVYRDARRQLAGNLGIEPSSRLQDLQRAILSHDPSLDVSTSGAPSAAPAAFEERLKPRRSHRWRLVGAAALAAVAAMILVGVLIGRERGNTPARPPAVQVKAHTVAVIDPETNSVIESVPVGDWPGAVAAGNGYLWVANAGDDTVSRVDPASRRVDDSVPATTPIDLAVRGGILWVANGNSLDGPKPPGGGTVERYATRTRVLETTRVGPAVLGGAEQTVLGAGTEGVWAANADAAHAYRLDPRTGRVTVTASATIQAGGIAVGAGSIWVTDTVNDVVFRIDPSGRVVARIPVEDGPTRVAVGERAVWVVGRFPTSGVWRIDPKTNRVVAHIEVPARAGRIAVGARSVWVTSGTPGEPGPGTVSRIDPETNRVQAQIDLGSGLRPDGVAVANGLVWVAVSPAVG